LAASARPVRVPVLKPQICPGGQAAMAQFLQIPAKDKVIPVAGFVQSRSHEFGR